MGGQDIHPHCSLFYHLFALESALSEPLALLVFRSLFSSPLSLLNHPAAMILFPSSVQDHANECHTGQPRGPRQTTARCSLILLLLLKLLLLLGWIKNKAFHGFAKAATRQRLIGHKNGTSLARGSCHGKIGSTVLSLTQSGGFCRDGILLQRSIGFQFGKVILWQLRCLVRTMNGGRV